VHGRTCGGQGTTRQRARREAHAPPRRSPLALAVGGWLAGLLTTALILGTPYLLFAYHSPGLHLVLDSVDACVALLVAYLVHGRFSRSRRLQDLLLSQGLFLLGVAGLAVTLLLGTLTVFRPGTFDVWLPLAIRVTGAALIAVAAVAGRRRVPDAWKRLAQAGPWMLTTAVVTVLCILRDHLPEGLAQSPPASAQRPVIVGHPGVITAQVLTAVCFLAASVGFTLEATRRHDELLRWVGPACAVAGFARVNYALFPSLYSGWVYTGDLLRTGSYLLLLIGAAREIRQYWSNQARVAVLEDRRRLARELHDGVVQELGYIRSEAHGIPAHNLQSQHILAACDRALDEARAAVDALGRSPNEPLGFVLHRAARQVAERYAARVDVELDDSVNAGGNQRHALVRITREAVSNAIRHGEAQRVCVRLERDGQGQRLVIQDDGRGFDMSEAARVATGYGLMGMEERARALPASFRIDSFPGSGTRVTVRW
jgi:signal transduction histidine kinase